VNPWPKNQDFLQKIEVVFRSILLSPTQEAVEKAQICIFENFKYCQIK